MTGRVRGLLAAVPLLLALPLAGCGAASRSPSVASAGNPGNGAPTTPAASLSPQQKALKFAQCMREHGVDMPDPDVSSGGTVRIGGPGVDLSKADAALAACREFSPIGAGNRPDPAGQENMRKFAQCMRDNGVPNFPDPDPSGPIKIDKSVGSDPDFQTAQAKCAKEFLPRAPRTP
jgi:hypothetical protein